MKYIKGLDALRALAVAIVVIGHSRIHLFYADHGTGWQFLSGAPALGYVWR